MKSGALRIALIYMIAAMLWIIVTDLLMYISQSYLDPKVYDLVNSGKGLVFVAITGYFLHKLIRANEIKLVKAATQSLESVNEAKRLGNIITRINNIVIITDKNNYISWVNKAFEKFSGYRFEEVAGYSPATFFAGAETDVDVLSGIFQSKRELEAFSAEVACHDKSGQKFWVYGEYTPLFDDNNQFTGYIAVYNDITSLKQKEKETAQQNKKLREIAWLSSHEVRRPINNIIGLTNLLKSTPYMSEKERILESIDKSAEELEKIVRVLNLTIGDELEKIPEPEKQV